VRRTRREQTQPQTQGAKRRGWIGPNQKD